MSTAWELIEKPDGTRINRCYFATNHPPDAGETYLNEYVAWSTDGRTAYEHTPCLRCLFELCDKRGLRGEDYVVQDFRDSNRERQFAPCHHCRKSEADAT